MDFWKEIEENLWDEGFDVMNENNAIQWRSEKGSHNIELKNIAVDKDKLAWYQDEEYGKCWVKIRYTNNLFLNWRPISNHSDYGFRFHFIKWYGNKLILIYGEKHREYIVKIENFTITILFVGNISEIQITNERIYVKNFDEIIQVIYLSPTDTSVSTILEKNLINLMKVEMKSYSTFFTMLDNEYNKNYS